MATPQNERLSQLWQFPLLLLSLGLFSVAAYLFLRPAARPTLQQEIAFARSLITHDRPLDALTQLNRILETQTEIPADKEAIVHLMLGESLEKGQDDLKLHVPQNYRRIIQQTRIALAGGAPDDAFVEKRLAESYQALGDTDQAVDHYKKAIDLSADSALDLRRKMIEVLLNDGQDDYAYGCINEFLHITDATPAERSWAIGQKAMLLISRKKFDLARKLLVDAIQLNPDPSQNGVLNYYLGYCSWRENDPKQAERYLRLARDQMKSSHPMDGEACYVLGRIFEDRNDPKTAESYYSVVLLSHPETESAPLAEMGRGVCRMMQGDLDAGMADLHDMTKELAQVAGDKPLRPDGVVLLRQAEDMLTAKNDYMNELEVLNDEQQLMHEPPADFYLRLAQTYESRAAQLAQAADTAPPATKVSDQQQARDITVRAGDAYIAYSRALTLTDDKEYGQALWHGIDLYDQAGDLEHVISALDLFIEERPTDKLAADAMLRLGRAYQAAGLFDKAIHTFEGLQLLFPDSLAASQSAVPMAQTYMAIGPQDNSLAEQVLLGVLQNNNELDPSAVEFRQALFQLAELYYRTQRYEEAIGRLEEMAQRYPADPDTPRMTFLMGDSYRKSALKLGAILASANAGNASAQAEMIQARRDRLTKAADLFRQVEDLYANTPPTNDVEKTCLKLANFYRADCTYDLGDYERAVKLYEEAAFRYQDDPSSLAAYVQIVNSYCALGRPNDARAANERARWILRRMPDAAFANDTFAMPRQYWEGWLKWTSDSGIF